MLASDKKLKDRYVVKYAYAAAEGRDEWTAKATFTNKKKAFALVAKLLKAGAKYISIKLTRIGDTK